MSHMLKFISYQIYCVHLKCSKLNKLHYAYLNGRYIVDCLIYKVSVNHAERKRRVYDQYGKEGLNSSRGRHTATDEDYDFGYHSFPFTFRDPEEVFREFFGGSCFGDLFPGELLLC